jgi:hypothetical protein
MHRRLSRRVVEAAMTRMASAGTQLATNFAPACELQADWKALTGTAMLEPFIRNLPEYGLVLQNFRNNTNRMSFPGPFNMVK